MRIIDASTTRRRLPLPALIEALRRLFIAGCHVPPRHTHRIGGGAAGESGTLLLMPAWREGGRLGIKTVTVFPANRSLGKPTLHSTYLLVDASTGDPLAQIDGGEITARRTAAASALAASFLARPDASRLLVVGAGRVASLMAAALRAVRPIDRVEVWARDAAASEALAKRLRSDGFDAVATIDLGAAARRADIVSCATLATSPLIDGEWLRPGAHLDLIGGFTPHMRESNPTCFARSRVFVDTEEAMTKSGDVLEAIAAGAFAASDLQGTLAALCRGSCSGRTGPDEVTLFKSVGTALEDLAAAEMVFDAVERGGC